MSVHLSVCAIMSNSYLSYGDHWKLLLYLKIAYNLRECHNFDSRSFEQVQSHGKEKVQNFCLVYCECFLWRIIESSYFTQRLLKTFWGSMILTQGHSVVQGHWKEKVLNQCLVFTFLIEKHWIFLLHIKIA